MRVRCPFCGAETNAVDDADKIDCPSCGQALSVLREAQTITQPGKREQVETSTADAPTVARPRVRVNCFQCSKEFLIAVGETGAMCPSCGAPYSLARANGDAAAPAEATPTARTVVSARSTSAVAEDREGRAEASIRWLEDHFEGRYEILDFVSRGGMGAVFRVRQKQPAREIAMKVMLAGAFANDTSRKRFAREAHAIARLNHPAIVPVYEFDEVGGQPYFTMEFVDGSNLRVYVAQNELSREQICRLMVRVCDAIHYAHEHGVIHRDLKPGNIMVDSMGRPRILDFGLSRATVEGAARFDGLTVTGDYMGTPRYMSPEQAMGSPRAVDERTDVYALGVILYELIVGVLPYPVEHAKGLKAYEMIQKYDALRPSVLHPNMPRDLELILLKAVQKDKEERYATAEELARDLENYLEDRPITARPTTLSYRLNKWAWRRRRILGPAIVALLAIAVVSFVYWKRAEALQLAKKDTQTYLDRSEATVGAMTSAQFDERERVKQNVEDGKWREAKTGAETLARTSRGNPILTRLRHYVRRHAERRVDEALADFASLVRRQAYAEAQDAAQELVALQAQMPYDDLAERLEAAAPDFEQTCWIDLKSAAEDAYVPGDAAERIGRFLEHWPDGPHTDQANALLAQQAALDTEHFLKQHERAILRALADHRWQDAAAAIESAHALLTSAEAASAEAWTTVFHELEDRLDAALRLENAGRMTPVAPGIDLDGPLKALDFAPDGSWFAAASYPRRVTTWSWPGRRKLGDWQTEGEVRSVAISPDATMVATGDSAGKAQLWKAADGRLLQAVDAGKGRVDTVLFSHDGTRLLSATKGEVRLWSVATGAKLDDPFAKALEPAAFAPDGIHLATAWEDDKVGICVAIWRLGEAEPLFPIVSGTDPAALCFSPDGRLLAGGHTDDNQRRTLRVWDMTWGEPVLDVLVTAEKKSLGLRLVWGLAFSPDGALLATGDAHGTVKLWDVAGGKMLKEFPAHQRAISCAAFAPDSRALVTGGNDDFVHFWGTTPLPRGE